MIGKYRLNIYDSFTGALTYTVEDFQQVTFGQLVNGVTSCTIQLHGQHGVIPYLTTNALIEVWRQIPGHLPAAVPTLRQRTDNWYVEWAGLFTDINSHTIYSNGNDVYVGTAYNLIDLLQRREILWYATDVDSESKKTAIPAQTAIYEFVEENLGASATAVAGRIFDGTMTGLVVPLLIGSGPNWTGSRAWRNVLETIQEIALYGSIDFDVSSQPGGTFVFETYPDQLGRDRTTIGLDPTTGLNAAGYPPVIFDLMLNNVSQMTYSHRRSNSCNLVVTTGQGQYTGRAVGTAIDMTDIDGRRLNQREMTRNANTQDDAASLVTLAEEWLSRGGAVEDLDFVPYLTPSTLYGVHFWLGDRVTARFAGQEYHKRLSSVNLTVDRKGETFSSWKFETIP